MKKLVSLFIFVVFGAGGAFAEMLTDTYAGEWSGSGHDLGSDNGSWEVQLTIGPFVSEVSYPDFPCTAVWEYIDLTEGAFYAREVLTTGQSNCTDGFFISVQKYAADQLYVRWLAPSGTEYSNAILSRVEPKK